MTRPYASYVVGLMAMGLLIGAALFCVWAAWAALIVPSAVQEQQLADQAACTASGGRVATLRTFTPHPVYGWACVDP